MAESPSSTSEKPPIEKLGLGLLIPDTASSDPINPIPQIVEIQHPESSENAPVEESDSPSSENAPVEESDSPTPVMEETAANDEDAEFRNAIESDLCQLAIERAEIEGASKQLESFDGEEGNDLGIEIKADEDEEKYVKFSESVEDENENEGDDEENDGNVASKSVDGMTKLGRYNQSNSRRRVNYPMRPDAEDCSYYMKFGSCKFGLHCKFNHPPRRKNQGVKERANHREENSERGGQTECKYYLTSGGCKYGKDCKYSHGADKSLAPQIPEFNFLGLPIRMGEKECPYYMRTGSCKYGSNCRFHHPEPVTVGGGESPSGFGSGASLPSQLVSSSSATSWSSPRAFNETSPFVPVMFPPTHGVPTSNQDWKGYQTATFPTSERSLPTPPAFAINNLQTEINFPMHHQHDILVDDYPERPGEPECSFFLKTGDCKYKSNCKFHHPKNRMPKPKANSNSYALNDKGLPLRPDQPICTHYHRYGICKFGPACKYDHSSNSALTSAPYDLPPFGTSNFDSNLRIA